MILKEKTLKDLNISIDAISENSHKKIWVKCDYCGSNYICSLKNRTMSYKNFPKDCCNGCKFKKREEVSLHKYGVKNSSQRKEVREKIKESNKNWINSEAFNKKRSSTMLKKYGTDNVMKSKFIRDKIESTLFNKYGVLNPIQIDGVAEKASKKAIQTRIKNNSIQAIDGMTLPQKAKEIGLSRSFFGKLVKKLGIEDALSYEASYSSLENKVFDFLTEISLSPSRNICIDKKKPDIVLNNLIIECDGLYWHCDANLPNKNYHQQKMLSYKNKGFKPLFFRGDEIENKFPIVCSIIKNALCLNSNKIFARKCEILEISAKEAFDFCESYHLMGGFKSPTHSIGLFYNDALVSVFQVKQLKKGSGEYDLSRYCTIPDTSIIGGFTKALSYFEKTFHPNKLQTFIDLRYGDGDYLQDFGFKEDSCYLSFQWTDGIDTFHRMKFKGNSGYEHGLYKIWDCGQRKMIKIYSCV